MNGFLLDTHIWIWYLTGSPRLPKGIRILLDRSAHETSLSPISLWEFTLLVHRGKYDPKMRVREWIARGLERAPFREAALTFPVAEKAEELAHLGDPGDTLIAATALTYDLTLLTVDRRLRRVSGLRTRAR